MNFLKILLIFAFLATNLNAADWAQTSGPKKDGNYLSTNTIQFVTGNTCVVGADGGGIYRTTNSGTNWTNVLNLVGRVWKINKNSAGDLYAGTEQNGVYKSTNGGLNWVNKFDPGSLIFDVGFDDNGNVYICTEIDGVYKSTDNGNTWNIFWATDLVPSTILVYNGVIYVGTLSDGIYYSEDEGNTFEPLDLQGDIVWSIVEYNNSIFASTEMSGLHKSTDGYSFSSYAFPNLATLKYFVSPNTDIEYVIAAEDIYRYNAGNQDWEAFVDGLDFYSVSDINEDSDGFLLASTFGDGVFRTTATTKVPEILTISSVNSEYCAGEFFTVNYTVRGGFSSTNNFVIQLSDENGNFDNPTIIGTTQSQVSGSVDVVIPFDTPQGANYIIRIVSTSPVLVGPNTSQFIVNELNTDLTSPVNDVIDVSLTPTFSWVANNCALSYSLQISKLSNFSDIEYQFDGLSNNSYTMQTNLEKGTKYYWRVMLLSNLGDELYTNAFSFTTFSTVTQTIKLATGWNLVSSFITNANMNIVDYLSTITDNILIVKNPTGLTYIPEYDINQIGNWNNSHGYQIYVTSSTTLELTGEALVPENHVINLNAGWNRVGYTRNSILSAETAFAQLTDNNNLLIAKNLGGQVYIPSYGINTLGDLLPGQGYIIYVINSDSYSYPAN